MEEKNNTAPEETKEENGQNHRLRRKWIAVGASVCALAIGLAFVVPRAQGSGQNGATATLEQQATSSLAPSAASSPLPTPTLTSTPEPAQPTPEPAPSEPVPTEPAQADFSHSAIVGSSTTQGLYLYGVLPEPDYFYHTSLTLEGLYDTVMDGADKPIINALGDKPYDQIFLAFGLNELGWDTQSFLDHYAQVIDTIRAEQPQAVIYIESLLPVGPVTSARNRFNVNQDRINEFNAALAQFAPEHGAYFLDVSTSLKDETGYLPDAISADGIHLNQQGCAMWADLLRTRVTELLNSDAPPVVPDLSAQEAAQVQPPAEVPAADVAEDAIPDEPQSAEAAQPGPSAGVPAEVAPAEGEAPSAG